MVGLAVIIYFVVVGLYAAYELHMAPHLDDNGNVVKKENNKDK